METIGDVSEEAIIRTSTMPVPGGTVTVMVVGETTEKLAGVSPKRTEVTPRKFVPVIVIELPPVADPEAGLSFVTVGPKKLLADWGI